MTAWSTRVELSCGCFKRFEQTADQGLPAIGQEWPCVNHEDQIVFVTQAWRHGR